MLRAILILFGRRPAAKGIRPYRVRARTRGSAVGGRPREARPRGTRRTVLNVLSHFEATPLFASATTMTGDEA